MAEYARPDDDLALSAAGVTASAEDPAYLAVNLIRENPAKPAKLTTVTGDFVVDHGSPVTVVAAVVVYQYLDAGLEVRLQRHSSNSWGAPTSDELITIPTKRLDGPANQRWTVSPILRLAAPASLAFTRLVIVGANSQPVVIGRLMLLSALREVTIFHDGNSPIDEGDTPEGQLEQPTELGVETIVTIGGPRRNLSAVLVASDLNAGTTPVQAAADFRALAQSAESRQRPFLLVPFAESPNDAWLVRFEGATRSRAHQVGGYQVWPFSVKEVSRGLPWP